MNRQDNQNQSTMQSGSTSGGKTCYNCKATTHFIRDCPDLKDHPSKVKTNGFSQAPYSQRGGRYTSTGTFNGRGNGRGSYHKGNGNRNYSYDQSQSTEGKEHAGLVVEDSHENCCISSDSVTLVCGHQLPVMTAACRDDKKVSIKGMPVVDGLVNGTGVKVLRDTGCSGIVVKTSLVKPDCLLGRTRMCVLVDGTVRKFPMAKVQIDCPYYVGEAKAVCAESPVYNIIIGNIPNVRDPGSPNEGWNVDAEPVSTTEGLEKAGKGNIDGGEEAVRTETKAKK